MSGVWSDVGVVNNLSLSYNPIVLDYFFSVSYVHVCQFLFVFQVTKTSQARLESEIEHHRLTVEFQKCQTDFKSMENRLRRSIKKSR